MSQRSPLRASDPEVIADRIRAVYAQLHRPVLVGISGFGGAGKSTLADALQDLFEGSAVVPGDEFIRERPTKARSDDWATMDRRRLVEEVLSPVRRGVPTSYQVLDWSTMRLGPWVAIDAAAAVVIVEGLGLFHPDLDGCFDVRVWIDVDLETATAQGMWRDEHVWANPQTELWLEVWQPNDADFFSRFRPDLAADISYAPGNQDRP